ncbi:predicted protein [Nematostella vectensis]|uniref:UBA domain-containing protein n=1 Tax=Nematostella vectensis TaxID=45351 RepID=A7RYC3_NEMVE|nr:predicted protein [Nematostella vectensis]|eukprot:XP_001635499.1 predicted protein [Nematostella vectensis]
MFPGTRNKGFYRTPVSKSFLILTGSASLINIFLASSTANKFLSTSHWLHLVQHAKVWQFFSSTISFSSTRDLICGSLLLYWFRVFERRFGSKKFCCHVFANSVIAAGLQLVTVYGLRSFGHELGALPSGPYGVIFAFLVYYYLDVPSVDAAITVLALPISSKIPSYFLALQLLFTTKESLLAGTCGIVSGLLYKHNFAYVQQWLKIPDIFTGLCSRMLGRYFEESTLEPRQAFPMGATLEIQEQQRMELYEQQIMRRMAAQANIGHPQNRARAGQGYSEVMVPAGGLGEWLWGNQPGAGHQGFMNGLENGDIPQQQPTAEVSEDQVQTLVEMGFSRQDVLHALTVTNNDINTATNVLLANAS